MTDDDDAIRGHQPDEGVEGLCPFAQVTVGSEGRGSGRFDQIADEDHAALGQDHHQIAFGVPASEVDDLDAQAPEVAGPRQRETDAGGAQVVRRDPQGSRLGEGVGRGQALGDRVVTQGLNAIEGGQAKQMIAVGVRDDDVTHGDAGHGLCGGEDLAALVGVRPSVDDQRALRASDEADRDGIGHGDGAPHALGDGQKGTHGELRHAPRVREFSGTDTLALASREC